MRWINALVSCTETAATATARFAPDDFPVADEALLESALVECVAQTVAAALASRARSENPFERRFNGVLAAVSGFRIESIPPLGKTLQIEVRELKRFGPMLLVSGVISCEGRLVASGELTLNA
jgi:predicted hotdog family 3-hydroxylacyl-ACP dehydratase